MWPKSSERPAHAMSLNSSCTKTTIAESEGVSNGGKSEYPIVDGFDFVYMVNPRAHD